jgi:hypothetical protein
MGLRYLYHRRSAVEELYPDIACAQGVERLAVQLPPCVGVHNVTYRAHVGHRRR